MLFAEPRIERPPNEILLVRTWPDGRREVFKARNARTDAGASAFANNLSGTPVAPFIWVAASSAQTPAVAKGDTTLTGEITSGGLARAQASFGSYTAPAALNGNFSYVLSWTWIPSAAYTIWRLGLWNASTAGTLALETIFASAVTGSGTGETLNGSWQCNG